MLPPSTLHLPPNTNPLTPSLPARRAGFTLIELLGVIMLIAILMGMIFGAAQMVLRSARNQRNTITAQALELAIANYRNAYGQWPVDPLDASLVSSITNYTLSVSGPQNYKVFDMLRTSSNATINPYNTNNILFIDNSTVFSVDASGHLMPRHQLAPDPAVSGLVEPQRPIVYPTGNGGFGYYSIFINFDNETVTVNLQ